MANSDTILGRFFNRTAFARGRPYRVSVYCTRRGQIRYSDPVVSRPKASVLYRIIVRPHGPLGAAEPAAHPIKPGRRTEGWRIWAARGRRKARKRKERPNG